MLKLFSTLKRDMTRNTGSFKSMFVVIFFRLSGSFAKSNFLILRIIGIPIRLLYKFIVEFVIGVELPDKLIVGPGLAIFHGVGLVVNKNAQLGENVTLRQCTTIGAIEGVSGAPKIGNNVDIGANAVIIGDIEIGESSKIGAGAIVVDSCPPNSILISPKTIIENRSHD